MTGKRHTTRDEVRKDMSHKEDSPMEASNTSDKSPFSILGLAHKFFLAFVAVGGTVADVNKLAESSDLLRGMLDVLQGRAEIKAKTLATWRKLTIGGHKSVEALVKAIEAKGYKLSDWARDIAKKVTLAKEATEVELVMVTVGELGFKNGATRKDIYDRAISLGLSLCPAEVGMQLRLQYEDQPKGEWLLVAMEPITGSGGGLDVFRVVRDDDDRWLGANYGHPGDVWNADDRWVFLRSKQ